MTDVEDEEWFFVADDEDPDSGVEPELQGIQAALIDRLRAESTTWSNLDVEADETLARLDQGVLQVGIDVPARGHTMLATLRVDVTEGSWKGGWSDAGNALEEREFENTVPEEVVHHNIQSADTAIEQIVRWYADQLRRPVDLYIWRQNGEVTAKDFVLADAGVRLVFSGRPDRDHSTADEVRRVRP